MKAASIYLTFQVEKNLISLYMGGYFCDLYIDEDHFKMTDAIVIYSIGKADKVLWNNTNPGIDGVLIKQLTITAIRGSGECDPHGGWRDFTIARQTGQLQEN